MGENHILLQCKLGMPAINTLLPTFCGDDDVMLALKTLVYYDVSFCLEKTKKNEH